MALSAVVTKKSVSYTQSRLHTITFNLLLKDGIVEVLNRDITCLFHTGDSAFAKVAEVIEKMQTEINNYKSEQIIFNSAQLDTAVTNIQNGLIL